MPLTSGELAGVPPRTPHRGTLRARPPLTLCRSRPSPQRPPGLRSPAAGVGVGGAGRGCGREGCPQAGRTKASLASQRPIQRSAALPPPLPLPARSLKAERRARLSSGSRRGTGNDLSRFQPPTSPHRWALPRGGGARGGGGVSRPPAPSSLRGPHQLLQGAPRDLLNVGPSQDEAQTRLSSPKEIPAFGDL